MSSVVCGVATGEEIVTRQQLHLVVTKGNINYDDLLFVETNMMMQTKP